MKRYTILAGLLVLALAAAGSIYSRPVLADSSGFTLSELNGSFAFSADGELYPAFPDPSPVLHAAAVGRFIFDGAGGCQVVDQLNIASIGRVPATGYRTSTECTYTVNPDGTGELDTSFGGPPGDVNGPGTLIFAIVDKGPVTELRFIRSDLGAVAMGVAKEQ